MTTHEPVKRKVTVPAWGVSNASSSTSTPRIRARIDPNTTPISGQRPKLRATRSTASLRGGEPASRSTSPIPPVPSLPQAKARLTTAGPSRIQRSPSPTPSAYPQSVSGTRPSPTRVPPAVRAKSPFLPPTISPNRDGPPNGYASSSVDMSRSRSNGAKSVTGDGRARVKVQARSIILAVPNGERTSPSHDRSPTGPDIPLSARLRRPSIPSNRSSPGLSPSERVPKVPLHHSTNSNHLTASLPPTPPLHTPHSRAGYRTLPPNPTLPQPIAPRSPTSPQIHPVALPIETPIRDSHAMMYSGSGGGHDDGSSSHRSSTVSGKWITSSPEKIEGIGPPTMGVSPQRQPPIVDVVLSAEAEEARVNRKIADLEISNTSLLAINRSLEANKAKQRAEINRLRGLLQEALSGNLDGAPSSMLFSPDDEIEGASVDIGHDPALEERWEKLEELVKNMRTQGAKAVEEVNHPVVDTGVKRVLRWEELESTDSPVERGQTPIETSSEPEDEPDVD